jgi:hypothetical protein
MTLHINVYLPDGEWVKCVLADARYVDHPFSGQWEGRDGEGRLTRVDAGANPWTAVEGAEGDSV